MSSTCLTTQAGGLVVLRHLRCIHYSAQHIGDMTNSFATLTGLKKGSINSVLTSLREITKALEELQASDGDHELIYYRGLESGKK